MGKKKIKYIVIEDTKTRNITFNKRKAGLLKKAAEITMLTNIKLSLIFTDLSGNLINFCSPNFEATKDFQNHSLFKNVYNFTLKDYPAFKKLKKAEMLAQKSIKQENFFEDKKAEKIINKDNNIHIVQKQQQDQPKQLEQLTKKIQLNQKIKIIKDQPQEFQLPRLNQNKQYQQSENETGNENSKRKKGLKLDLKINIPTDRQDLKFQMDYIKYTHSRASDISQLEFTPNYSAMNKTGIISKQSNYQPQTRPTPIIDKKLMQYQQQQQQFLEMENEKNEQENKEQNEKECNNNDNKEMYSQCQQEKKQQEFVKQSQPSQLDFKQPLPSPRGAFKPHSSSQKPFYQQKLSPINGQLKQSWGLFSPNNKQQSNANFFNQLNSNQSPSQFLNNTSNQPLLNFPLSSNPFQPQLFPLIVNNNYQLNQNVLKMSSPKSASPFIQNSLDQESLAMQYQFMQKSQAQAYQAPLTSREFSLKNSCASFGDKQNQSQFSFQENIKNYENNNEVLIKKENEEFK